MRGGSRTALLKVITSQSCELCETCKNLTCCVNERMDLELVSVCHKISVVVIADYNSSVSTKNFCRLNQLTLRTSSSFKCIYSTVFSMHESNFTTSSFASHQMLFHVKLTSAQISFVPHMAA